MTHAHVRHLPAQQDGDPSPGGSAPTTPRVISRVWADISMDFTEALLKVHGKSVLLTVIDRFSKYAHFISLGHPYTAASVARTFFTDIIRRHGFLELIVSDRGPVFIGHIWLGCSSV